MIRNGADSPTGPTAWESFEIFRSWALSQGYEPGLSIERRDVDGDYTPDNCTFIPRSAQARNRRDTRYITAFGQTKRAPEWVRDPRCHCSISRNLLSMRICNGWDPERALTTPARPRIRSTTIVAG
jgi:hypothetical protein